MRKLVRSLALIGAVILIEASSLAQNTQQLDILNGIQLGSGLKLGINTSDGLTDWLSPEPPPPSPGDLKMTCPAAQQWCAMFISDGPAISTYPRPSLDLAAYQTMVVQIEGDPGTTIQIGIKDATEPDDGTETKVTLMVTSNWTSYAIPLSSFSKPVSANGGYVINFHEIYIPCEFVFSGGPLAQTVKVSSISYTTASTPVIPPDSIISASGFGRFQSIGAGSWIEIYGSNLARDSRHWNVADFKAGVAPTSLDGTSVTIGGQPAFVAYISPGQVNVLVPSTVPPGDQPVVLSSDIGASSSSVITVTPELPGLLAPPSFDLGGTQYAVALFPDFNTYVLPPGAIPGVLSQRAQAGDTIVLFGIGFGTVVPDIPAGQIAQQANTLALPFRIFFGTTEAAYSYNGLVPGETGLYQFNVVVPSVPSSDMVPLTFSLNGVVGAQTLYLAVQ